MNLTKYSYTKVIDSERLTKEIRTSDITIAFSYIQIAGVDAVDIWFKEELSVDEEAILAALVTNHIATPLERVQKVQNIIAKDPIKDRPYGWPKFVISADTVETVQLQIGEAGLQIRGGLLETLETDGNVFGALIEHAKFVDIDNVLGAGAGYVLNDYIHNWPLRKDGVNELKSESLSEPLPAPGLYLEMKINNSGNQSAINCTMKIYAYKK